MKRARAECYTLLMLSLKVALTIEMKSDSSLVHGNCVVVMDGKNSVQCNQKESNSCGLPMTMK